MFISLRTPLPPTQLPFSPAQITAIHTVHDLFSHRVRIFERNGPEKVQGCILLGEVHRKHERTKLDFEFAFPEGVALECYNPLQTWGYRCWGPVKRVFFGQERRLLPYGKTISPASKDLDLEYQHKPDLHEHVSSLIGPLAPCLAGVFGMEILSWLGLSRHILLSSTSLFALAGVSTWFFWGGIVSQALPGPPFFRRLLSPLGGDTFSRDRTMARNINNFLAEEPKRSLLPAIVGRAHMAGIAHYLTKHHGFTEVALPAKENT
ncbi:MAG: hypothetical protein HY540_04345 [Deltaproteobacteria bacterium]|nr:hypothetical protein [Deltaproteobacteria bacterium]